MRMKKEIVFFFGSGWFVIPVVEKLLRHNLVLVVTNESSGKLVDFLKENNIPYISTDLKDSESIEKIKSLTPTVAILASYGAFIPDGVLNLFPKGIINIHPSLLPLWKGPSPIQYSLLNGDTVTGVTLIKLDDEIDHGPIISQRPYNLKGDETTEDLLSILFEIGSTMAEELIIKLENGEKLIETPQDHSNETWSYKIEKKDGQIDVTNPPQKEKLINMIRAFYPWPGVWFQTELKKDIKLIKLLPDNKIQVEGKNPMSYKDFANGYEDEGKILLARLHLI